MCRESSRENQQEPCVNCGVPREAGVKALSASHHSAEVTLGLASMARSNYCLAKGKARQEVRRTWCGYGGVVSADVLVGAGHAERLEAVGNQ
jgi:hypothetical protein